MLLVDNLQEGSECRRLNTVKNLLRKISSARIRTWNSFACLSGMSVLLIRSLKHVVIFIAIIDKIIKF